MATLLASSPAARTPLREGTWRADSRGDHRAVRSAARRATASPATPRRWRSAVLTLVPSTAPSARSWACREQGHRRAGRADAEISADARRAHAHRAGARPTAVIAPFVHQQLAQPRGGVAIGGLLIAWWLASHLFAATGHALDYAYGVRQPAQHHGRRRLALAFALGSVVVVAVSAELMTHGPLGRQGGFVRDSGWPASTSRRGRSCAGRCCWSIVVGFLVCLYHYSSSLRPSLARLLSRARSAAPSGGSLAAVAFRAITERGLRTERRRRRRSHGADHRPVGERASSPRGSGPTWRASRHPARRRVSTCAARPPRGAARHASSASPSSSPARAARPRSGTSDHRAGVDGRGAAGRRRCETSSARRPDSAAPERRALRAEVDRRRARGRRRLARSTRAPRADVDEALRRRSAAPASRRAQRGEAARRARASSAGRRPGARRTASRRRATSGSHGSPVGEARARARPPTAAATGSARARGRGRRRRRRGRAGSRRRAARAPRPGRRTACRAARRASAATARARAGPWPPSSKRLAARGMVVVGEEPRRPRRRVGERLEVVDRRRGTRRRSHGSSAKTKLCARCSWSPSLR